MLCDTLFYAENQPNYNKEWGVVFSPTWGENHSNWLEKLNTKIYASLTNDIDEIWNEERMTEGDKNLRDKFMDYLSKKVVDVYPGGHLLCGGSSISTCGSLTSDMDLCFALKTSDKPSGQFRLPIEKYSEEINLFMIDRLNMAIRDIEEAKKIQSINAKVPIVKFDLKTTVVDPNVPEANFEFDINCNCVAGIYNAYLLGGLANFDERLPKLAIILKKWAKSVKLVNKGSRFNSYLIVLLIVHYLQCGVEPPVLPNLMKLCPEDYDGTKEPWNLTTNIDRKKLPESKNRMSVGALLCGFFRYYAKFDFNTYGILIKDASIIKFADHGRFNGCCGSRIFVEEPYDGLTVPKNIKHASDFDHIMHEFKIAEYLMHPKNDGGRAMPPRLEPLLTRYVPDYVATTEADLYTILST